MSLLLTFAQVSSAITGISAAVVLLVRPLRDKLLGAKDLRDGQRCLLRHNMLHTYYRHKEEEKIRQYEMEDFIMEYKAYKSLGGNSFIDKIYAEVKDWEVVT